MKNIQQEFLDQAALTLKNLSLKLTNEPLDENLRREVFRIFHTLKGTSQTFNFGVSAKLAHELENLLHAAQTDQTSIDRKFDALLAEGVNLLRESFCCARDGKDFVLPQDFTKSLKTFSQTDSETEPDVFANDIPAQILSKLSIQERKILGAALHEGKTLYAIEVEFSLLDFDEKFRSLRGALQNVGEIIATFPKENVSDPGNIGFRIYSVSRHRRDEILETAKLFDAELTSSGFDAKFSNDLEGVLKQSALAGEMVARRLGKTVEFETTAAISDVSAEYLRLISDVLLHLIRNAADHAIEKKGKIKIEIYAANDDLILRVSDDGRGLDAKKIKAVAIAKNLIRADEKLSRQATLDLIFTHGFSTAEKVSEISGRGVGLDAVKDAVEKVGGSITVKSRLGAGTTFEIVLPQEK